MGRVLVAGPCVSEFGWELCEFQGRIRRLARDVDHVVISSTDGHLPLYADMNPVFIPHRVVGQRDCHRMRPSTIANPDELQRVRTALELAGTEAREAGHVVYRAESIPPRNKAVGVRHPIAGQIFVKYGNPARIADVYPIVIHARARRDHHGFSGDNYPKRQWVQLLALLADAGFSKVAAIGLPDAAIAPPGTTDHRGGDLQFTMDLMAAATIVIGPSSGPMHLASLCHTAHVVWTGNRRQPAVGANNKLRYTQLWNPLKTPVNVVMRPGRSIPRPEEIAAAALPVLILDGR